MLKPVLTESSIEKLNVKMMEQPEDIATFTCIWVYLLLLSKGPTHKPINNKPPGTAEKLSERMPKLKKEFEILEKKHYSQKDDLYTLCIIVSQTFGL